MSGASRLRFLVGAMVCSLGQTLTAQSLDRSQRPVAPPAVPFHFPVTHERILDNGLRVIVVENHALPLVVVRVVLGVDSLSDPAGKEGLFALDTAMLREGTSSSTPEQQSAATAQLGNAVSPLRFTTIPRNFSPSLTMMADMLMHPAFPASAFERQKAAVIAAGDAQRQAPYTIVRRVFFAKLLGDDHPLARTVVTSAASVGSIDRDDLMRFHDSHVRPNGTTLVIVGDVHAAEAFAVVARTFGEWKRAETAPSPSVSARESPKQSAIYILDRPGVQQSVVFVGLLGADRESPGFAALEVMAPIVGSTPASRLQQNLREKRGWVYSANPAAVVWRRPPFPSMIYGSASVATGVTDSVLIEWTRELKGIGERAPSDQEMTLARGALLGTLPAQIETDAGVADRITYMVQNALPLNYYDRYVTEIGGVTSAAVLAAAQRAVDTRKLVIVVAGDRKVIEASLRAANIAPVVVVDENGKPIG